MKVEPKSTSDVINEQISLELWQTPCAHYGFWHSAAHMANSRYFWRGVKPKKRTRGVFF